MGEPKASSGQIGWEPSRRPGPRRRRLVGERRPLLYLGWSEPSCYPALGPAGEGTGAWVQDASDRTRPRSSQTVNPQWIPAVGSRW